ncbi:hypothetical protein [Armatimonas rosea]|uniref:HAF family extracellular repeat protein n=1 Tax=Armatimonas rosea TaxID=685828 RepID=A0A7W9SLX1_ARMRO|nr:hypothetical protein [Armatimonas rosea]MBB6048269.1 hypothetical protein [Armatimonas rosea]
MNVKQLFTTLAVLSLSVMAHAQTAYQAIDLTPSGGTAAANGIFAGQAAGSLTSAGSSHAALFSQDGTTLDLHPSFLNTATVVGRSTLLAQAEGYQVGSGTGTATNNRLAALCWTGTAESASVLFVPFDHYGAQANAVGGGQIVGQAQSITTKREVISYGPQHALLWDAASGAVTDLHPGGNGTVALGVGGGKQVGYEIKSEASAVVWSGSARSMVSLHPAPYDASVASATDGLSQVGYAGVDVQIYVEKRGRRVRFNYAMLWSGTATSFQTLDSSSFRDTYATGVSGSVICGTGAIGIPTGTITSRHAIAWTGASHTLTDLHRLLPAGFASSTATGVDAQGNISGTATLPTGERHAIVWVPVP